MSNCVNQLSVKQSIFKIKKKTNNLKNTIMYTVHIYTDGSVKKSFNFPTIDDANQSVQRHASDMSLEIRYDQDGWAFAYDPMTPVSSPFRDEIFIFEII